MHTLVLLPGLDGTGLPFADFVAALGPEVECIVISYPPDRSLGYAALEALVRNRLPQDRPFFLLGESFSGPLAIAIAAAPPAGLRGLILSTSFASNPRPRLGFLRHLISMVPMAAIPHALIGFFVLGRFATPPLREMLKSALAVVRPSVLRARARAALAADSRPLLSRIRAPILYLRADEDRVVPSGTGQQLLAARLPASIVEFPAPHFLLQVLPEQAAKAVRDFMQTLASPTPPEDKP